MLGIHLLPYGKYGKDGVHALNPNMTSMIRMVSVHLILYGKYGKYDKHALIPKS